MEFKKNYEDLSINRNEKEISEVTDIDQLNSVLTLASSNSQNLKLGKNFFLLAISESGPFLTHFRIRDVQ